MNITLGDTIKRLRREKDVTQEKLADHLNISCQAISKWERGECYPDISMLIPIASYFGISVDELLGVDHAKNELEIQEYIKERQILNRDGKTAESQELTRRMTAQFPNDFRILLNYVLDLVYDCQVVNGAKEHRDEIIKHSTRILEECFDDDIRYETIFNLINVYSTIGETEKALQLCDRFPAGNYTKNSAKKEVFHRGHKERIKYIKADITDLVYDLSIALRDIALEDSTLTLDEQIVALEKGVQFLNLIYDHDEHGFHNYLLSNLFRWIGNRQLKMDLINEAYENYEKCLQQAVEYDRVLGKKLTLKSLFVRGYLYDMNEVSSGDKENLVRCELNNIKEYLASYQIDDSNIENLMMKYEEFAKDKK